MSCPRCKIGQLEGGTGLFLVCPFCHSKFDLDLNYMRSFWTEERRSRENVFTWCKD